MFYSGCYNEIMEIQVAVSKNVSENINHGCTCYEAIERPQGGVSLIISTSQKSPITPHFVTRKVANFISEGVRDSAAARAVSDSLFVDKNGNEQCSLTILTIDLLSGTIVLSQNSDIPLVSVINGMYQLLDQKNQNIGGARNIKPVVSEFPISEDFTIIFCNERVMQAGNATGQKMDMATTITGLLEDSEPSPQELCDAILAAASRLENNLVLEDQLVGVIQIDRNKTSFTNKMKLQIPVAFNNPS